MTQFICTLDDWSEDNKTQTVETTEGRKKLKSKMNILSSNETPEQLMIYLKDFKDKILKNIMLTTPDKLGILRRLVHMEAQTIVSRVEGEFESYSEA